MYNVIFRAMKNYVQRAKLRGSFKKNFDFLSSFMIFLVDLINSTIS